MNREIKSLFNPKSKYYLGKVLKEDFKTDLIFENVNYDFKYNFDRKYLSKYEIDVIKNFLKMWATHLDKTGEKFNNYIAVSDSLAIDFGLSEAEDEDLRYKIYVNIKNS